MATYKVDETAGTITIEMSPLEIQILLDNYTDLQEAAETLGRRFAFDKAKNYTLKRAQDEYARQRKAENTESLPDYFDDEAVMQWWLDSDLYPGTASEREG